MLGSRTDYTPPERVTLTNPSIQGTTSERRGSEGDETIAPGAAENPRVRRIVSTIRVAPGRGVEGRMV